MLDSRRIQKKKKGPQITQLVITITNCEFVKDFNYFIAVQLDREGEKVTSLLFVRGERKCPLL